MNDIIYKGWCPTLSRPMETGDGWLVRLHLKHGIVSAAHAHMVADCARRYGNGHIDLTSRGGLQIRGVKLEEYEALVAGIASHGLVEQPRPERVAHPDYAPPLGFLPTDDGRGTAGLALAFGRMEVAQLHWLADAAQRYGNGTICLSAWRAMFLPQVAHADAAALIADAVAQGFITDNSDARRMMRTCPGAPACSSAHGDTRALAAAIAVAMPNLVASGKTIHVSGCAKGCACPQKASAVVTARAEGYDVAWDEVAGGAAAFGALTAEGVVEAMKAL